MYLVDSYNHGINWENKPNDREIKMECMILKESQNVNTFVKKFWLLPKFDR